MAKIIGAITVDVNRCKGCELCVVACPADVLGLQPKEVNDRGYHYAYMKQPDKCIACSSCALVCPDACIEVYRVVQKYRHPPQTPKHPQQKNDTIYGSRS